MARIAVLGEAVRVEPFALAGAVVAVAEDAASARSAWIALPTDIGVVIVTPAAAATLTGDLRSQRGGVLTVTMP
jgi:vacuolar-type H+-ATPase subunit F/Vma7